MGHHPLLAEASRKLVAASCAGSKPAAAAAGAACPQRQCFSPLCFSCSSSTGVPGPGYFPRISVFFPLREADAVSPAVPRHTVPQAADLECLSLFFPGAAGSTGRQPSTADSFCIVGGSSSCSQRHSRTQLPALARSCGPHIQESHPLRLDLSWRKKWSSGFNSFPFLWHSPPAECSICADSPACFSRSRRSSHFLQKHACCRRTAAGGSAARERLCGCFGTRLAGGPRAAVGSPANKNTRCYASFAKSAGPAAAMMSRLFAGGGEGLQSRVAVRSAAAVQSSRRPVASTCAAAAREAAAAHSVETDEEGRHAALSAGGDFTRRRPRSSSAGHRVCIVGAGPAGFYCAKYLLQAAAAGPRARPPEDSDNALKPADIKFKADQLRVDMLEKLPAPYGLVRYGVAPDHPEIKRVAEDFDIVAQSPSFRYFGNVELGKDVSLPELRSMYDAIIFAYGASGERRLRLEGDDRLLGCLSARSFVGFYNAHPDSVPFAEKQLPSLSEGSSTGLDPSVALVIGNGNVSLDIARLLTKRRKKLQSTDVHEPALAWIARANLRLVVVVGRRGWVQASFTNKELRELVTDDEILPVVHPDDFNNSLTEASKQELAESRLKQRSKVLLEQMVKNWELRNNVDCPVVQLRFLASPVRTLPHPDEPSRLGAVELVRNILEGQPFHQQAVRARGEHAEVIPSSLLIWSTGFKCVHPRTVQFPTGKDGVLTNNFGRIVPCSVDKEGHLQAGVYASGWARRGPHGVVASNIMDAREVVANVLKDLEEVCGGSARPSMCLKKRDSMPTDEAANDSSVRLGRIRQAEAVSSHTADSVESTKTSLENLHDEALHQTPTAEATSSAETVDSNKGCIRLGASSFRENNISRDVKGSPNCSLVAENQNLVPAKVSDSCPSSENGDDKLEENAESVHACDDIATLLRRRGVQFITFDDWLHIKSVERAKGQREGKSAIKIATAGEMLRIARERVVGETAAHVSKNS